jgi:hypothetical protein
MYGNFNLATINIAYAQKYCGFNFFILFSNLNSITNWVIISNELLQKIGKRLGDDLIIDGKIMNLVGSFSREEAKKLLDIDGYPLFTHVIDGMPYQDLGDDIDLITSDNIFETFNSSFIKVSFILEKENTSILEQKVSKLLNVGTDISQVFMRRMSYGPVIYHISGFTYLVHIIKNTNVMETLVLTRSLEIHASWIDQLVITFLGIAIIYQTALAVIYERRKDFMIMSIIGANPSFITLNLLFEAIIIGVITGVLSYVIGFGIIWLLKLLSNSTFIAIPSGLFHMI